MNPIINQMLGNFMDNIFQMYKTVKSAQNPNAMMQTLANTNSQLQQVMQFIGQNGGNARQLFFDMAKQKGRDPNTIINQLNNM